MKEMNGLVLWNWKVSFLFAILKVLRVQKLHNQVVTAHWSTFRGWSLNSKNLINAKDKIISWYDAIYIWVNKKDITSQHQQLPDVWSA